VLAAWCVLAKAPLSATPLPAKKSRSPRLLLANAAPVLLRPAPLNKAWSLNDMEDPKTSGAGGAEGMLSDAKTSSNDKVGADGAGHDEENWADTMEAGMLGADGEGRAKSKSEDEDAPEMLAGLGGGGGGRPGAGAAGRGLFGGRAGGDWWGGVWALCDAGGRAEGGGSGSRPASPDVADTMDMQCSLACVNVRSHMAFGVSRNTDSTGLLTCACAYLSAFVYACESAFRFLGY